MPRDSSARAAEKAKLLIRCQLTLDAIARAEPSPLWAQMRTALDASAGSLANLREMARELTTMAALLPPAARADLASALTAHGIDLTAEGQRQVGDIAAIRSRGRIRTEAEYRRVRAYADGLAQPEQEEEYLALGAMLDAFMARPRAT